ncbi:MAG TPA: hypothetical protein VFN76_09985 [Candidatus Limnocylindria bacterium]|nr:hypothetical protein [Candidatus Limnocylindria bacterium]
MPGALAAAITAATRGVVPKLIGDLGELVTFYVDDETGDITPGNEREPHWVPLANGANIPARVDGVSAAKAVRDWGHEVLVEAVALVAYGPGAPVITAGHAMVRAAGGAFRVVDVRPSDLGNLQTVALQSTREQIPEVRP